MSIPEAKRPCGRYMRVARRGRLLVFSLHHHDEEDSAFVPATEPADSPIIDTIAQRDRLAKPKEICLNVHGYSSTHIHCSVGENSQTALRESIEGRTAILLIRSQPA